ncbi:Maf family protein [Miltoncostaea marina]|uniref:Maf family protein n=1 Tax=Miltoncostaea marina TaxID=2843215 RepID=UPI001C3D55FF|nr:Maf family protein [Miltoncostaea marina]
MILLASRSPQRRALLGLTGVPFRVAVSGVDEGEDPLVNARAKARDVAARLGVPPEGAVLGADTEVLLDGRALGKPADADEAAAMLRALAGRGHVVRTAVHLVTAAAGHDLVDDATVAVRPLGEAEVAWYAGTGEWRDRAGGYAIQGRGATLVARIEGDHSTVVGLPLGALSALLGELGLAPWARGAVGATTTEGRR